MIPVMRGDQVPREELGRHRVGVIPYCVVNKSNKSDRKPNSSDVWICLGIDRRTRDITDFGGGLRKNESITAGAWREFKEESGVYFQDLQMTDNYLKNVICIHNSSLKMTIFFLPVPQKKRSATVPLSYEMHTVKWINFQKIFQYGPSLYYKFHNFLKESKIYLPTLFESLKNRKNEF